MGQDPEDRGRARERVVTAVRQVKADGAVARVEVKGSAGVKEADPDRTEPVVRKFVERMITSRQPVW